MKKHVISIVLTVIMGLCAVTGLMVTYDISVPYAVMTFCDFGIIFVLGYVTANQYNSDDQNKKIKDSTVNGMKSVINYFRQNYKELNPKTSPDINLLYGGEFVEVVPYHIESEAKNAEE